MSTHPLISEKKEKNGIGAGVLFVWNFVDI